MTRPTPREASGVVDTARSYVALMKPRIIELLLVTTVPTMVLAQGGVLPWLMAAVVLGGTLAAKARRTRSTCTSTATSTTSCGARGIVPCRATLCRRGRHSSSSRLSVAAFIWLAMR